MPRTLYVHRPLINGDAVADWAKANGFGATLLPADMHVTVAFSKAPVDWSLFTPATHGLLIAPGSDRTVTRLGAATVLRFASAALAARWREFGDGGASWDWPDYQPHVTVAYAGADGLDVDAIPAYAGELRFGPEVFAEVNSEWASGIVEKARRPDPATRQRAAQIVAELELSGLGGFDDISEALATVLADAGYRALAQVGVPDTSDLVDRVNERAVAYASERAAELVSQITETTRAMLRDTIAQGLADNVGTPAIADLIRDAFAFSDTRSALIANTEVAFANSQATLASYQDAAAIGTPIRKVWLTAGDDLVDPDICQPNEDVGPIPLDALFPSGHDAPPGHPNCRCVLTAEVAA